jgi:hypothetical protein
MCNAGRGVEKMLPVYTGGVGPSRRFSLDAAVRRSPAAAGEGGAHAKRGRVRGVA